MGDKKQKKNISSRGVSFVIRKHSNFSRRQPEKPINMTSGLTGHPESHTEGRLEFNLEKRKEKKKNSRYVIKPTTFDY